MAQVFIFMKDIPIQTTTWKPIHFAAYGGDIDKLENLLSNNNKNEKHTLLHERTLMGFTPLHSAIQEQHVKCVRYLLRS